MEESQYIALKEARTVLDIKLSTMYRLLKNMSIPTYRLPGHRRTYITRDDFERLRQPKVSRDPKA